MSVVSSLICVFSRSLATRNLYYDYYDPPSVVPHKKDPDAKAYYIQDANDNATRYSTQGK